VREREVERKRQVKENTNKEIKKQTNKQSKQAVFAVSTPFVHEKL